MRSALHSLPLAMFLAVLVAAPMVTAQPRDPFQRTFTLRNSLPITIYPVIQAPQDKNCGTGGLFRIIVNKGQEDRGVLPGEEVTVMLPKTQPCTNGKGPFYDAARIYVSVAPIKPYEALLNAVQVTVRDTNWDYVKDPLCEGCWFGRATGDYGLDGPQQLIEYTIISQNPADGSNFDDPNDRRGTPFVDFDVSYVDHTYLPVAMALDDGGATQFMGSTLDYATFNQRSAAFVSATNWALFGAFRPEQWATPAQCPTTTGPPNSIIPTSFSCMVGPRTDRIPSLAGLMGNLNGTSLYYWPVFDPKTSPPPQCGAAENLQCSAPTSDGGAGLDPNALCCPNPSGKTVGCCKVQNFVIAGTTYWWHTRTSFGYRNPAIDGTAGATGILQRFTNWTDSAAPCIAGSTEVAEAPVPQGDQVAFCKAFKRTVDYAWSLFTPQCTANPNTARGNALDRCVASALIAYDLKASGFDPNACKQVCPGPSCPSSCVVEKLRTESVQALQRALPWGAFGDPQTCAQCPSEDGTKCPAACIYPSTPQPADNAKVYHYDGFLHFWADYGSVYNLNPFARFVHNADNGLASPGAYSFSIDDFYGNFGGPGSGLLIETGGTTLMPNKEPYDPYKQYHASFGSGWDHAEICGRRFAPPPGSERKPFSVPVSFWNHGAPLGECLVKAFKDSDESKNFVVYRLVEVEYPVVDTYTGQTHKVRGLSHVYAYRGGNDPIPVDSYCQTNSNGLPADACRANLTFAGDNLNFVSVSNAACTDDKHDDATCGKPLIFLAVPSLP